MSSGRVAEILTSVAAEGMRGSPDLVQVLVTKCATDLPITGVGLSWMTDDGPAGTFAATDGPARVMEELQFDLGEGPCVDCSTSRSPVLQSDLARTGPTRWPAYSSGALEAGIRAVFAFPIQVGGIRLGVLDLYRDIAGMLDEGDLTDALAYAEAATALLLHLQTNDEPDGPHPSFAQPLDDRAEVHQATGMVATQLEVPLVEALALLRARAYADSRPVVSVAKDILERSLRLER